MCMAPIKSDRAHISCANRPVVMSCVYSVLGILHSVLPKIKLQQVCMQ